MKIRLIKKMPRWVTIPGLTKEEYRALQAGKGDGAVEVSGEAGQHLLCYGYVEIAERPETDDDEGGDK